ncbi:mucoidy inhibitor MuiA family protein [Pseudenhygromyxa sp. WMMC2535]|uniref:mucoidy inhibitor MuiA family protein n=1 Tax=Pseudenhygromyxa sp. WMMC2535 TaxID=2712867 RepID=UPI0015567498|nr:mucoidy inhibitor MuiA family protein [Pseudenhygromyxa sp. WMMC2535]NVB37463.1 mucoidy inhibitor MuiA family protein [Pseudenhygromyxa sp. WMMC2535]
MASPALTTPDAAPGQGARELIALVPVTEVTLLEDRAMVTREGVIELPPGRVRVFIHGVAPVLVDKTLSARLSPPPGEDAPLPEDLQVRNLSIDRRRVSAESELPTDVAEIREQLRNKERELEAKILHRTRIDAELGSLHQLFELTLGEINEDVAWGRQERPRWREQVLDLESRLRELSLERRHIDVGLEQLQDALKDLRVLLGASSKLDSQLRADLSLELHNTGPVARRVRLRVDYLVPGAMWRPWHRARLIESEGEGQGDDQASVALRCDAAVWQATGEDWSEVALRFSTERPSLGVAPPRLHDDPLRVQRRGSTVEVQAREEQLHDVGLGADQPATSEAVDELPGIDDGGEARLLSAATKASVPGDGRPHRVPIFEFEAPAEVALLCAPELVPAVMLRSRHANAAKLPLLAGPVDLIRNSGLVGRTSLAYVAPGERFELGWGPDPSLRVHREVEELEVERRMMSAWTRKPRKVEIKLSNLSAAAKTIELRERIAVSELEKVEVEFGSASQGVKPDRDGMLRWTVALAGFGREQVELRWTLIVHDDVVGL